MWDSMIEMMELVDAAHCRDWRFCVLNLSESLSLLFPQKGSWNYVRKGSRK